MEGFVHPQYLVSPAELERELGDPALRILESTVFLHRPAAGERRFVMESGRGAWAEAHIPTSAFADLVTDLSDPESRLRFMMPSPERFAAAMGRLGAGDGTRVVVYDRAMNMWAARLWWMLRAFGFQDARVLDGGWRRWTSEGRPSSVSEPDYPPATFRARFDARRIATRDDVLAAIAAGAGSACIVNALSEDLHAGRGPSPYGRQGRIASSVNVPAASLVDPETHAYLPVELLRKRFAGVGATAAERVITYCGGGIAASSDALILTLLGHDDVAVYDASMSEWAADQALPMESG